MIDHLTKYLKKIGVTSYEELNAEEKETFKEWELSLNGRRLTDQEVSDWLEQELDAATVRLTEVDLKKEDEIFRKVEVRFIKKLQTMLRSPELEKQMLVKQIESQL